MRKQYSKKEIRSFLQEHPEAISFTDKKSQVVEEDDELIIDGRTAYRRHQEEWIPSLEILREQKLLPEVIVDKGTPPYIAKGADLMRPGIISCEEFGEGAVVSIVDEQHHYPIATGKALFSSNELMRQENGKVVAVLHNLTSQ